MTMMSLKRYAPVEEQIDQWRAFLRRRQAIHTVDVTELEDHLREHINTLTNAGLAPDEAFLVAVKRMGALDELSREFAREHSERLWKQLVVVPQGGADHSRWRTKVEGFVAFGLAAAAGVVVELPRLFGFDFDKHEGFFIRNASLFVLPLLTAFFAWKRKLSATAVRWLAVPFVLGAVFANAHEFVKGGAVERLVALHLPMALWLAVGIAYAGGRWKQAAGRMDFIRFSGELFIYYVLIALGGGVLTGITLGIFSAIGLNLEPFWQQWVIPCGAAGAVIVASWLVEAKQSVIENMAPVLTRIFTPLFAVVMMGFLGALAITGQGIDIERNVLIMFDALLALVVGLQLYSLSARDPDDAPGPFDVVQFALVSTALVVDVVALSAIGRRISEFGFTPNRVAALGENVILLVNLAWSAVLYLGFLRGRRGFAALERWQTDYLPVYATWATIVVALFPIIFGTGLLR